MKCVKCGSKNIKTRINYPFGKKSRSRTTIVRCRDCGCKKIKIKEE